MWVAKPISKAGLAEASHGLAEAIHEEQGRFFSVLRFGRQQGDKLSL